MSYSSPKGVVFDGTPCGTCSPCETRARIKHAVDEIIAECEPEIEHARTQWSSALDAERRGILPHGSDAEEWRVEVCELIKARDMRLNRVLAQYPTIPPCANMRLRPRITTDCTEVES